MSVTVEALPARKVLVEGKAFDSIVAAQDWVDALSPELRACVHEFGFPIVHACVNAGVTKPGIIRHLVTTIWSGGRSNLERQSRGRAAVMSRLDALLLQSGAALTAAGLGQFVRSQSYVIAPVTPTNGMVAASMATIASHDVRITKYDKHKQRLLAALKVAAGEVGL